MPATSTDPRPRLARRDLLAGGAFWALAAAAVARTSPPTEPTIDIQVWKDPNCGCCKDWITQLQASGFRVSVSDRGNIGARRRLGIAEKYGSCHTAQVGGYAIEGHVPAREIRRLMKERPQALGLAVPGMPVGSPGMDGPVYGDRKDPYDVLLLSKDGSARVYQTYR